MTLTEDRLRAALGARADLVTQSDLRPLHLPAPVSTRSGWLMPLAAAAAVAAVLGGTAVVLDSQGAPAPMPAGPSVVESADPSMTPAPSGLPSPVASPAPTSSTRPSTPPKPDTSTPPEPDTSTPPESVTSTPPKPATSASASATPVPSTPPKEADVKQVRVGRVTLEVPESWQADQGGGDTTCVGPTSEPCDGVLVAAAGEAVTDASDVGSVNCSAGSLTGPERVQLTHEPAWYASFPCGWRHRWVLEDDPFYSLAVIGAEPDGDQLRAIRSARLAPAKE